MAFRTSNPALSAFEKSTEEAGWAAAQQSLDAPAYRGRVAGDDTMTVNGVAGAAGALIVLVIAAAFFGWNAVEVGPNGDVSLPAWAILTALGGFGIAILTIFKPALARFTSPVYALLEGAFLGAISHAYNAQYEGIVVNAVGLTIGVFVVMLLLYVTRAIRVTDRLRSGIVAATGAVMLVYLVSFVVHLFGGEMPLLHDASPMGIAISLFIVGLAAFNLLLDFDLVEKGVEAGAPRHMEWFAAFGLLVTLVWLYLELLRLLSKLQRR